MKKLLITLLLFQGITAVISGIELMRTNGLGMPVSFLSNSPFTSFLIPGLILTIIIGGTSLLAAFFLLKNHKFALHASAAGGFGILIWIFTEQYMIHESSFLQVIYFSIGILILTLTMLILKKGKL